MESGTLVEWAGPETPEEPHVYEGQPGLVVDDGGPTNISVQLVGGPSLVAAEAELRLLDRTRWNERTARLRAGTHPVRDHPVATLDLTDWP